MNSRTIIIGITILIFAFAIILFALLGVFKYKPEWVGLPPNIDSTKIGTHSLVHNPTPIRPVSVLNTIEISESKLASLEAGLSANEYLKSKKDSIISITKMLRDSIDRITKNINYYKDSVNRWRYNNNLSEKKAKYLSDSLQKIQNDYKTALEKAENAKKRLEDMESIYNRKTDSLQVKNFSIFAKMYNSAKPQEVARILEQLDERDAAKILKLMQQKKAGKVIEAMKPENAAAILLLGSGE